MMGLIVTQGLTGDCLLTQGWSLDSRFPRLITQGLGGDRLLVQGLATTGSSGTFSASGGLFLGGAYHGGGAFATDSFTGAAGTPLSAHTSDSGSTWSLHPSFSGATVLSGAGRVRSNTASPSVYIDSAGPTAADYDISADVVPVGAYSTQTAGVVGRLDFSSCSFYGARYNCALDSWELYRVASGTYTALGTAGSPVLSTTRRLTLRMAGSQITVLVDGAAVITKTDSVLGAPGRPGLWFVGSSTNLSGPHLDNWQAAGGRSLAGYVPGTAGGVSFGARASAVAALNVSATGGSRWSGPGRITETLFVSPAGGLGLGGRAGLSPLTARAAGGLWLGGHPAAVASVHLSAAGGTSLGAAGAVRASIGPRTSGGWMPGGAGAASRTMILFASGGMPAGGSAKAPLTLTIAVGGGCALSGNAIGHQILYYIYSNAGTGDAIDYTTPKAVKTADSWTSAALNAPGDYKLAVRAYDARTGLEERNVDAVVELKLDVSGNDVTLVPAAPLGLRAFPIAGGKIRVEWSGACGDPSMLPVGFNVYCRAGSIDYSHPAASVPWAAGRAGSFSEDLGGLTGGVSYSIAVRAFTSVREEPNKTVVVVAADTTPPVHVDSLVAIATAQE
jgi:hypothetical protein